MLWRAACTGGLQQGPWSVIHVSLDEAGGVTGRPDEDVLAIHDALTDLEAVVPHACRGVELRFFGGLLEHEAAAAPSISLATLKRDWVFARAWLFERTAGIRRGG